MNLTLISYAQTSNGDSPETFKRTEPLLLSDLQMQSRLYSALDPPADDPYYLENLIATARDFFESETQIQLLTATWELRLDGFPRCGEPIYLPLPPVREVLSLKYIDTDGTEQTLFDSTSSPAIDAGIFVADLKSPVRPQAGEIYLAYGQYWPTARWEKNAVRIQFQSGFGDTSADVPAGIKQTLMVMAATLYRHREAVIVGTIQSDIEFFRSLLDRWRWRRPVF